MDTLCYILPSCHLPSLEVLKMCGHALRDIVFGRIGSARLMVILDNLKGLFNLNDSVILLFFFLLSEQHIKQFSSNSVSF